MNRKAALLRCRFRSRAGLTGGPENIFLRNRDSCPCHGCGRLPFRSNGSTDRLSGRGEDVPVDGSACRWSPTGAFPLFTQDVLPGARPAGRCMGQASMRRSGRGAAVFPLAPRPDRTWPHTRRAAARETRRGLQDHRGRERQSRQRDAAARCPARNRSPDSIVGGESVAASLLFSFPPARGAGGSRIAFMSLSSRAADGAERRCAVA